MFSNVSQIAFSTGIKGPRVCQENIPQTITAPPLAWTGDTRPVGTMDSWTLLLRVNNCWTNLKKKKKKATFLKMPLCLV